MNEQATQEHDVLSSGELVDDIAISVMAGQWDVLLVRTPQGPRAIHDRCPHAGARLNPGPTKGGKLLCAMHGARFDVLTGQCVGGSYDPVRMFPAREENGRVLVTTPARPPGVLETPLF